MRITIGMTLGLCLTLSATAGSQTPGEVSYADESLMPEGIAGERIAAVIAAINSNDPEHIRRFVAETFSDGFRDSHPLEEHVSVLLDLHRVWGGVDFHGVRTYVPPRPDETVVILEDRNFGAWRAFVIQFEDTPDSLVAGLGFSDARTPTNVEEPRLTEAQAFEEMRAMLERVCQRDAFSGTALVARGDEVLISHACGEASKRFHVANDIDTRFNLGSMNKMFTATAVAQLVERGRLSYDEAISAYVDESWLPRDITDRVTVHHLLSHTSGLGSYFNDTFWQGSRARYRDVDDFKPLVRDERLAFEPGARFRYSNTGMLLAGVVVESVTGGSYFDYVRENIYAPAGMERSDSYEMDIPVENLAIGYEPDRESEYGWRNNLFQHVIKGGPAGGGFSTVGDPTVGDLHRFARALTSGAFVSAETLELMWTDHSGAGYGYGFGLDAGPLGRVVGHNGGFPGISASLDIFVDSGWVVAVLSNYGRAADPVARQIRQLLERTVG